jgi:hypothetical protein
MTSAFRGTMMSRIVDRISLRAGPSRALACSRGGECGMIGRPPQ